MEKSTEIKANLLDEIEVCERLVKKMNQFSSMIHIYGRCRSKSSTVTTGGVSIAAFASGTGLPIGISLSGTSLISLL